MQVFQLNLCILTYLQKEFVEKHKADAKKFGMLRRFEDSQQFLIDNPDLVCEETANVLVIWCIDLAMEEVRALNSWSTD